MTIKAGAQPQTFAVNRKLQPHRARKIARMRRLEERLGMVEYPIGEEKKARLMAEFRKHRRDLGLED